MGFGLDLDWLVGLAWWAMVVAWWVVGCLVVFAMGLLGFWWVLFRFFLFWVFGSGGFGEQRAMVAWWVVGCLFVFAMGLLGPWWVFFFFLKFLVPMVLVGRGQWWCGGDCLFGC